ncbi:hypothetical protein SNE40_011390 [Patella caerulea]|uniref:SKA complex subunit 1 n=1 Tax=Patella caerulea TaxID=87958 RepID=A0AAN8JN08_PATCE
MESSSVEELAAHFNEKLSNLNTVCELRHIVNDPHCKKHVSTIERELQSLEITMALLKQEISKQKEQLKSVEEVKKKFHRLIKDVNYTTNNIPARLPNNNLQNNNNESDKTAQKVKPLSKPGNIKTENNKEVKRTERKHCPSIEYLTVDEFEEVPKYMKGRVTYNQVNSLVDELNKTFIAKYKILHMKKSTMNDISRKRFENYKIQENKDTEGVYFVVEVDIKDFSSVKMDAITRSILTTLRHCGRIREVRGGKLTRYAIIESY